MAEPLTAVELAALKRDVDSSMATLNGYGAGFPALDCARLLATVEAYREIVAAVAAANPYGGWYPADSAPPGVVCRWCMERASSPQACQHDAECTWSRARALPGS